MSTFPDPQQPPAPGVLFDLDPPGPRRQVGLRPPGGPLGARPARSSGESHRKISRRPALSCSITASSGFRPSRAGSATRSTASFTAAKTWSPSWPNGSPKLTVDQVNAAVRKHLKTDGMKVAIVARDAAGLRELLTSGKPTPLTYDTQGTPEDVLAEDKQIAVFPLKDVSVRIVPVEQMFEK